MNCHSPLLSSSGREEVCNFISLMDSRCLNCHCTKALVKETVAQVFLPHYASFELQFRVCPGKTAGNRRSWLLLLVMSGLPDQK